MGLSPYRGGFVTLDVFFVLSGFLITLLLLREVERSGRIDLVAFYVRRARRILPAATVAIVGTVVASYLWINPLDARDAAVDGVWASLFVANVRFAIDETDYFAQDDLASPLQHFWSLSVEEQFYLVLPALLLVTVLLARRTRRGARPVTAMATVLAVVTAASFAWSVHASQVSPQTAYFSTFTRSWEFGVGALLAIAAPRLVSRLGPAARNGVALGGLALVGVALFTVSSSDPYPGWLALMPVLGTGAVLVAGSGETGPTRVSRALGVRPLRTIGDASYSLYLWHWPVIVVAEQRLQRDLRPLDVVVVLGVTALMTWASYRYVETPFRHRRSRRRGQGLALYPAALGIAVGSCLLAVVAVDRGVETSAPAIEVDDVETGPRGRDLSDDPVVALVEASVKQARQGAPVPGDLRPGLRDLKGDTADLGRCDNLDPPWRLCRRGDATGEKTVVVLGDSHGRHWIPAMEEVTREAGWAAYYLVKSQCTPVRVEGVLKGEDGPFEECADFNAWAMDQLEQLDPDLVVVSTTAASRLWVDGAVVSDQPTIDDEVRRGFRDLFADLAPLTRRTTLLVDVPSRTTRPAECLSRRDATLAACLEEPTARRAAASATSIDVARRAGVDVVRTEQWVCADGQCPAVVGDMVVQRDTGHLTTVYSRHLAGALGKRLGLDRRGSASR
ncbi:acyltransferase family protein [Nocardioides aestuarii]